MKEEKKEKWKEEWEKSMKILLAPLSGENINEFYFLLSRFHYMLYFIN